MHFRAMLRGSGDLLKLNVNLRAMFKGVLEKKKILKLNGEFINVNEGLKKKKIKLNGAS